MTRRILVLSMILSFLAASAQNSGYTFKVLVSKGKTEVKSGTSWSPLKVGTSLNTSDEIKLSENSYIGLIHATGKPLELKESGNYSVVELSKRVGKEKSVLNKYTDFILSSEDSKKNRMAATGAVHRGEKEQITLFLPGTPQEKVYGNRIVLNWLPLEDAKGYIVVFKTLFDEELARFETESTSLDVDLDQKELKGSGEYLVKVLSKANPTSHSEEFVITRLSNKENEAVKKELEEVTSNMDDNTAFSKFYMAGVYEQKMLVINAITAYQDAIRLEPEVDYYKEAYQDFLTRLGFKLAK